MTIKENLNQLDENKFRKEIIIPIMRALGCSFVRDNHSATERGIDVLYEKKNILRKDIYGGIILKNSKDIGKNNELDTIDRQAKEAISRFDDPQNFGENRIKELFIITSFNITSEARRYIHEQAYLKNFLNYHICDGDLLQGVITGIIVKYNENQNPSDLYTFGIDNFKEICENVSGIPILENSQAIFDSSKNIEGNTI